MQKSIFKRQIKYSSVNIIQWMLRSVTRFRWMITTLLLSTSAASLGLDLYVAPNGNDSADGSIARPLKTLEGARNKVRAANATDQVRVFFRAGTYPVTHQVNFTSEDSGEKNKPIIYSSYNGETAFFDGLKKLDISKFSKVTGSLEARLDNAAKGKAWSVVITDTDAITLLKNASAGLSFNGYMLRTTASPNRGFFHVSDIVNKGTGNGTHEDPKGDSFFMHEDVDFNKYRMELERGGKQAYVSGYLSAPWYRENIAIQRFGSTNSDVLVLVNKAKYGLRENTKISRFRIKNMLATMDQDREWFFDVTDNRLYFMPPGGVVKSTDTIGIWAGPQAILVEGANHIHFERIVFQHFGRGVNGDSVITVNNGDSIRIAGVTIRYVAMPLAPVSFYVNAKNCVLTSSDIYDTERGSRLFGGSFNATSVTPARNVFENNHFTLADMRDEYGGVVGIQGAGNIFRNNLCHHMNGQPITHLGVDHIFEYNEIFNVGIEEGDGGAVYTGANLYSFGNILRYNFVHHIMNLPEHLGRSAFFSDDLDAGDEYSNNTLYKSGYEAIKMNKGSGHSILNNVIMSSRDAVALLGSEAHFKKTYDEAINLLKTDPNSTSKANYIGRAEAVIGDFANNATGTYNTSWDNSFWALRYPYLKNMLRDPKGKLGTYPTQVRVYGNAFYNNVVNFSHAAGYGAERDNVNISFSNFRNLNVLNFEFSSRPAGVADNRFAQIGLKTDAYRVQAPVKDNYRKAVKDHWNNTPSYTSEAYNRNTISDRIYYNSGRPLMQETQKGLQVKEGDASKNR
jgi:hypothetical protein